MSIWFAMSNTYRTNSPGLGCCSRRCENWRRRSRDCMGARPA